MIRTPKYRNEKVKALEGIFDSKLEYRRFIYLRDQQKQGKICNLRRQVKYTLIPKQTELIEQIKQVKSRGKVVEKRYLKERVLYKECTYSADFVYDIPVYHADLTDPVWLPVVEDTKSYVTAHSKEFVIKQKLMLFLKGIKLHLVATPADPIPTVTSLTNNTKHDNQSTA